MKYDVFLSICQTEVDGTHPDEAGMFANFFDQVKLADELGFETAWVAETHLSCQTQKENSYAVIPHFKGEIGLNTDILQMAHLVFSQTKNINVGSAIRNILCNGGPIAHAEAIKTFLSLNKMAHPNSQRKLCIGFASGRFEFSNRPYGIEPRNKTEQAAWAVVKGKCLSQATEIFMRLLNGEEISSQDIEKTYLEKSNFRKEIDWQQTLKTYAEENQLSISELTDDTKIEVPCFWKFEKVGVIPKEAPLENLDLILGSHDPALPKKANKFFPTKVFNLSITPPKVIEETHKRMEKDFHKDGGAWQRDFMPRTALVYLNDDEGVTEAEKNKRALAVAEKAWATYWTAMEGTLDPSKVETAVANTLAGGPETLAQKIKEKYHPEDRLMLWFDFNNHNNQEIKNSMRVFKEKVIPLIES